MNRQSLIRTTGALIVGASMATGACSRDQAGPEVQTSTGVQPRMEAMTVSGCLRAGLAGNTFVLTTTGTGAADETATYQLSGPGVNFDDYVGHRVQVSGALRAEQQVASKGVDVVDEPATGTSGTPVIETKTELNVKHLTVEKVQPSGERCAD